MYLVNIAGTKEIAVDIRQSPKRRGRWEAHLPSGEVISMAMKGRNDDNRYVIAIDGIDVKVGLRKKGDRYLLVLDDLQTEVSVSRAAEVVFEEVKTSTVRPLATDKTLVSPITGIVLETFVKESQEIKLGDSVVLIEAMKMENTLYASKDQKVATVHVKAGDTVFVGDPLITYE